MKLTAEELGIDEIKESSESVSDFSAVDVTSAPKRRGRKPKNPVEQPDPITGELPESLPSDEPKERKKRKSKIDYTALAGQIQGLHTFVAMSTACPELMLDEKSSAMLAQAAGNFANEFGLSVNPKVAAAIQLAACCAMVYIPRIGAIRARTKKVIELKQEVSTNVEPSSSDD